MPESIRQLAASSAGEGAPDEPLTAEIAHYNAAASLHVFVEEVRSVLFVPFALIV